MIKNAFYFILKDRERERELILISKIMTSQPGKKAIAIYILSNSTSKSNQTMKLDQLICEFHKGAKPMQWEGEGGTILDLLNFIHKIGIPLRGLRPLMEFINSIS